jgi:hypothetical protein
MLIECLDTQKSRVLFGYMRMVYNTEIVRKNTYVLAEYLPKTIYKDVRKLSTFVKMDNAKNNTEMKFLTKKKGYLPTLNQHKSIIQVRNGVITFNSDRNEVKFELEAKDKSQLKDGIYYDSYVCWFKGIPHIEIKGNYRRNFKSCFAKHEVAELLGKKFEKYADVLRNNRIEKIQFAQKVEQRFGKSSPEFAKAFGAVKKTDDSLSKFVKINLYKYIDELNQKYISNKGVPEQMQNRRFYFGENQANLNSEIAQGVEDTVLSLFELHFMTTRDQTYLKRVLEMQ